MFLPIASEEEGEEKKVKKVFLPVWKKRDAQNAGKIAPSPRMTRPKKWKCGDKAWVKTNWYEEWRGYIKATIVSIRKARVKGYFLYGVNHKKYGTFEVIDVYQTKPQRRKT